MTHPSSDDHGLGLGIRRRGLPRGPRSAAQLLLDRLTEVLQQVEAIGHLIGLRRTLASTLRVETASIPADDLYTGMPTQPSAGGLDRAVGQHVDDLALLEVDHDRPVTTPLLPGPVINPDHPQRRCFIARAGMTLETAQDRVIALWQSQACHQALCRTTARGMAEKPGQIGHPAGPSGRWPGDIGKPIAERLPFAALILASPSRQAHPQRDRRPLSRQILQPANLPAVTTGGLDITYRTSSAPLAEGQNCPATVAALRPKELEAGSQSPFGIFDHATIDPVCSPAVKPDPRSHEVRKTPKDARHSNLRGQGGATRRDDDVLESHLWDP